MPRFNPEATGVFFGITAGTTRAHMARAAIIEGIAFQYPPSVDALRAYGLDISELTVVDGEARSPVWNQLKADVLGFDVLVPEVTRAAGLGATMLAGVAAGEFSDLDEASGAMFHTRERYARTLPHISDTPRFAVTTKKCTRTWMKRTERSA